MTSTGEGEKPFIARMGLVRLFMFFFLLAGAYAAPQILIQSFVLKHVGRVWYGPVSVAAALVIASFVLWFYRLLVRWLERRRAAEADLRPRDFAVGMAVAIAMFAVLYALFLALGAAHYAGLNPAPKLWGVVMMVILSGVGEEVMLRGAVFRIVEEMFGSAVALAFSAALFGGLHLFNPHFTVFSAFAIAIEAGLLLGAAYVLTRNLWLAIGIHMGWNFAEGGIFGAAVSGGLEARGIFNMPLSGPDWLTGGSFGPEASVLALAVCTSAGLFFLWRAVKSGHWVPFRVRMMLD